MTIGVVIRTLNESELIGRCLETLERQRGRFDLDVLVVDSGSTDSTIEIAHAGGARIIELAPGDFDYSRALNLGIEEVSGDLVASLSAHAIPVDDQWLERMVAALEDEAVAGVSSRQVPWPDAPWQEVYRLAFQFEDASAVYSDAGAENIVFSNAASLIRRSVWREHSFTLPAAEDLDWARRVIAVGWRIVYEARAAVYHSHHEDARAQALRMIDINRIRDGDGPPRSRRRTLREGAGLLFLNTRKILGLDEPARRKVAYLADLVRMVGYYILDFSRSGTTAERRRATSSSKPSARRPA
jgi:glycosyltransferase involved in cell wall biosynthesis